VLAHKVDRVGLVEVEHVVEQLGRVLELVIAKLARGHLKQSRECIFNSLPIVEKASSLWLKCVQFHGVMPIVSR
jgi:hypothetical protein